MFEAVITVEKPFFFESALKLSGQYTELLLFPMKLLLLKPKSENLCLFKFFKFVNVAKFIEKKIEFKNSPLGAL